MRPHRLTGFATKEKNDPNQLDHKGFPKDQTTMDAIEFMEQSKEKAFFLYYATWLVHAPIHSRSKELLENIVRSWELIFPKTQAVAH